jgi:hypothetical protein
MDVITMVEPAPVQSLRQPWSPLARIAFRFCFVYFGLYCVLTQIILSILIIPKVDWSDPGTLAPIRAVVFWVGAHVFRLSTPLVYSGSGSGDKYFDWVLVFCIFACALIAAAVWSAIDRKRQDYATLQKWFRLFLRFCLGSQMLVYGGVKAVPLQMHYPFLFVQTEPFGNLSPMGVLWASIGASPAYETFAGCAELLGGFLLMFPRTVVLGALVCLADLTQIFVLNMTYDVPVKQFSFHLILISLLILAPNFKRLSNFFFLNRPVEAPQRTPLFSTPRAERIATAGIAFLWLWMIGNNVYGAWDGWRQYGSGAPRPPLYGIWNIEDYSVDNQPHPLLVTEAQQWRRIIFDFPDSAMVQRMDESSSGYGAKLDLHANTLSLTDGKDKKWKASFTFTRPAPDRLTLDGAINGQKTAMQLRLLDHSKFQLNSRGFHWIQDYPYNR